MRLCLGMFFQNDEPWLRLHLPHLLDAVDGIIAVDGGSTDNSAGYLRSIGAKIFNHSFDWNYGAQAQYMLDRAEETDFDCILRLDPDETMFNSDVRLLRLELIQKPNTLFMLNRINLRHDRGHWNPESEQYGQWRAWPLHEGIKYTNVRVHENPVPPQWIATARSEAVIYHYGNIKDPGERFWIGDTYYKLMNGKSISPFAPTKRYWDSVIPFDKPQPIDFEEVGYRAPLEAVPLNYHIRPNLAGDRAIEYTYVTHVTSTIPAGAGVPALDFGSGGSWVVASDLLSKGWKVTSLDLEHHPMPGQVKSVVKNILDLDLETELAEKYELIVACSSIEHVGLAGRYSQTKSEPNGDLLAMRVLKNLLRPGGEIIITIPIGLDFVHEPMHRVYGVERIYQLFWGFKIIDEHYWIPTREGWKPSTFEEAHEFVSITTSETDWQGCVYALGGFVLKAED